MTLLRQRPPVTYQFQNKGKFALHIFNKVCLHDQLKQELAQGAFRLSDGTWVMPGVPVPDLGVWKEWIGSLRVENLKNAELVLFVEEPSNNPEILDNAHERLGDYLSQLFKLVHLRSGITYGGRDSSFDAGSILLVGSSEQSTPRIRQMREQRPFFQSKGYRLTPVTMEWLEGVITLHAGFATLQTNKAERVIRGLDTLFNGLMEPREPNRLHQFVRSLEALILPDIGETKKQFVRRCQTFARAGCDTQSLLQEAFDMRSATEHLHPWDKAVQNDPVEEREYVYWQRTRQLEHLARDAYSRVLRNAKLRQHFQTDDTIANFWKLPDDQRRLLWGDPLDITLEPLVKELITL